MWVVMDQEASERKCDLSSLCFAVNKQTLRNALLDPGGDFFSTNTTKLSSFSGGLGACLVSAGPSYLLPSIFPALCVFSSL